MNTAQAYQPPLERPVIDVIIPVINEEHSIAKVIYDIPSPWVRSIYVCDNGSTDDTVRVARAAGACIVDAPRRGYGSACLAGMAQIASVDIAPDIVVFMDGDYSDHPEQLPELVLPIWQEGMDLVIASRAQGDVEAGAMTWPQTFGNWLATRLIRGIYGYSFTDLGPFRAIRYGALQDLGMSDPNYGWTVEMQILAAKHGLQCTEVPALYRKRIGVSKVSGTIKGSFLAGQKILWTVFKHL